MRRSIVTIVIALPLAALAACLSFGDLQGSDDAGTDAASVDAAADASPTDSSSPSDAANPLVDAGPINDGDGGIYACNALGLVAYWPMDEGSGTIVHECHQGLNGFFAGDGGVSWGNRASGSNLEFDGGGYVSTGTRPELQLPGPFTIAGWFRADAKPSGYAALLWNFDSAGGNVGYEIVYTSGGALQAQLGFGFPVSVLFQSPTPNVWMHLAAVFEPGKDLIVYVNGITFSTLNTLVDGGPFPDASILPNDRDTRFGPPFSGNSFLGGVDDVRVFSRALSIDEIYALAHP